MDAADVDAAVACCSADFVQDDRRSLSGDPIRGVAELRLSCERALAQYSRFEVRTLAVRGERLHLFWGRWSNEAGYESTHLGINEVDDDGRISYQVRFDEDDFEGAYRELEERYYAGEGAAFAEAGATITEWTLALSRGDVGRLFGELTSLDLCVDNRSRSAFPNRSAAEFRSTVEELKSLVASAREWSSATSWQSSNCLVARIERDAVGHDGEEYTWCFLGVFEVSEGRVASLCQFEVDDEAAAFAYAEERVRASASRLPLENRASRVVDALGRALQAHDVDGAVAPYSSSFVYDDRRRFGGNPVGDLRAATERILEQYNQFEWRTVAVRGERLHLGWTRWSNDSGFETTYLIVDEVDDDGQIIYQARFDEDDFEGAYRELDQRYFSGEGAEYADTGVIGTEWTVALDRGDFDRLFGELTAPGMRIENRSRSGFPDLPAAEWRTALEDLATMVASSRSWISAMRWVSPTVGVSRSERDAVGHDGEPYTWCWLLVSEVRDGRLVSLCQFEVDDEEAAFAYAEERVRASASRLPLENRASRTGEAAVRALRAGDVDDCVQWYSDALVHDDRRRLTGDPIRGMAQIRTALERILQQYSHFETRTLAVRGENLVLASGRWSNDSGYQSTHLIVVEVDGDGRICYQGRFDEDDFENAYRELERRYYAGERATFAEAVAVTTDAMIALNDGDLGRFGELTSPGFVLENRSRGVFPDRSAAEFRASFEGLTGMVASTRQWVRAVCWLSPTWSVGRLDREAVGQDGEQYSWSWNSVGEVRGGRVASMCIFEVNDEEAAFAYAEERIAARDCGL